MNEKIKIAERRIDEAQERAEYFAKKYYQTGMSLYKDLREEELKMIDKIVEAIVRIKKEQAGK